MPFHIKIYGQFAGDLEWLADKRGMLPSDCDRPGQFEYDAAPADWAEFKRRVRNARISADLRVCAHFTDWVYRQNHRRRPGFRVI